VGFMADLHSHLVDLVGIFENASTAVPRQHFRFCCFSHQRKSPAFSSIYSAKCHGWVIGNTGYYPPKPITLADSSYPKQTVDE